MRSNPAYLSIFGALLVATVSSAGCIGAPPDEADIVEAEQSILESPLTEVVNPFAHVRCANPQAVEDCHAYCDTAAECQTCCGHYDGAEKDRCLRGCPSALPRTENEAEPR